MTEAGMPETIVEIKKWIQRHIAKNARVIDRNDQIRRFNNGETKWGPRKKGLCNWLRISTDAKRHVMIWTIDGSDYMKTEARKLADNVEEAIKKELGQIVPVEFKDAPTYTVTCTGVSVGICRGELVTEPSSANVREMEPADDNCPF